MAYYTLTEAQIVANLINTYTTLITTTDNINPGSVLRSTFEAFAQELKRLYSYMGDSAAETQKTAAYAMFNFPLLPAQAAYTMATFSVITAPTSAVTVPAGTTIAVPGTNIQYKTPANATWAANSTTATIRVVCTQNGSIGNQRANTITQLVTPISGLSNVTVTNSVAVISGSDIETSDQRTNRFQQWVNSLHRGDVNALLYGAKTAQILDSYGYISEQVIKAQVVQGSGTNTIYVDNGTYNTSANLITQCQQVINGYVDANGNIVAGYKAAGIPSTVMAATVQNVTVTIKATPKTGYTLAMIQQSIIDSVTNLVQSLNVGDTLSMAALNLAIGNTPGVLNYQIVAPVADTAPAAGTLLKLAATPTVTLL